MWTDYKYTKKIRKCKALRANLFCAAGVELAQHELIEHLGLEQRLLVAEGLPDEDESHDGLTARVQPEGVEGVQRLLGGLVEGQVKGEAAVVLPAALVGEKVVGAVLVEPVEAVVQRQVGAELGKAAGAVLATAAFVLLCQQEYDEAEDGGQKQDGKNSVHGCPPMEFESCFPYCNTTRPKLCYNI